MPYTAMTRYAKGNQVSVRAVMFDAKGSSGAERWSVQKFADQWASARVNGTCVVKKGNNWELHFEDDPQVYLFKTKDMQLVKRTNKKKDKDKVPKVPKNPSSTSSSEDTSSDDDTVAAEDPAAADVPAGPDAPPGPSGVRAVASLEVPKRRRGQARPEKAPPKKQKKTSKPGPELDPRGVHREDTDSESSDDSGDDNDDIPIAQRPVLPAASGVAAAAPKGPSEITLYLDGAKKQKPVVWKLGGRSVDPHQTTHYGPKLVLPDGGSLNNILDVFACFTTCISQAPAMAKLVTTRGRELFYDDFTILPGEFILMLGIFIYMACYHEESRAAYWRTTIPEDCVGVIHDLKSVYGVSQRRFERFMQAFNLPTYPPSSDLFHEIRRFADEHNAHVKLHFTCSWICVVDESMVKWLGIGMPGWMFVQRKPRPMGRETHTICCAMSKIIFFMEIYEGADNMKHKAYVAEYGKSVGLVIRMTTDIHSSNRLVIADAGVF